MASRYTLTSLAGLILCLFWMVAPALTAPFVLSDDWDILQTCGADHRADLWEMTLPFRKYQLSPDIARFFPGTWVLKGLEIGLFGDAPLAYHSLRMATGAATVTLIFLACHPWLGSALAAWIGLAFIGGPQAICWMRLGYSETWSMLFVAAALWSLSRAARSQREACPPAALLLLSLTGWIKETFIPLLPLLHAVLGVRRSSWAYLTPSWRWAWLACCLQVAGLAWELLHDPAQYGGTSLAGFRRGLGHWILNYRLTGFDEWLIFAGCLAYLALRPEQREGARRWLPVVAFLVASQLLISAAMFGDLVPRIQVHDGQGRYLFPGLLAPLGAMFAVLALIRHASIAGMPQRQLRLRLATGLAALALLHRVGPQLAFQRSVAHYYTEAACTFDEALDEVDVWRDQHPNNPVVLLGSALDEEGFLSLATFLHTRRPGIKQPWMQVGPARGQAAWAPLRVRKQKEEWLQGFVRAGWNRPTGTPGIQPWPPPRPLSECLLLVLPRTAPSPKYLQGWHHVIQLPDGY